MPASLNIRTADPAKFDLCEEDKYEFDSKIIEVCRAARDQAKGFANSFGGANGHIQGFYYGLTSKSPRMVKEKSIAAAASTFAQNGVEVADVDSVVEKVVEEDLKIAESTGASDAIARFKALSFCDGHKTFFRYCCASEYVCGRYQWIRESPQRVGTFDSNRSRSIEVLWEQFDYEKTFASNASECAGEPHVGWLLVRGRKFSYTKKALSRCGLVIRWMGQAAVAGHGVLAEFGRPQPKEVKKHFQKRRVISLNKDVYVPVFQETYIVFAVDVFKKNFMKVASEGQAVMRTIAEDAATAIT